MRETTHSRTRALQMKGDHKLHYGFLFSVHAKGPEMNNRAGGKTTTVHSKQPKGIDTSSKTFMCAQARTEKRNP